MINKKELEALKKLFEEGEKGKVWWNKRIKKLELAKDFETIEAANMIGSEEEITVKEIEKEELSNKYKNLKIITELSSGNIIVKGVHKVLNQRLDRSDWEKVKHCFRYVDTREINDEIWEGYFVGYEIINEEGLRNILSF